MAKSKKQRRIEAKSKKDEKKFIQVVIIATLVLLTILYFQFRGA